MDMAVMPLSKMQEFIREKCRALPTTNLQQVIGQTTFGRKPNTVHTKEERKPAKYGRPKRVRDADMYKQINEYYS
jgi:hypothetical protein